MSRIYLIAGLGADTRVFNNIDLHEHEVICVDWIGPNKTDTLATYAQKLIHHYHIKSHSIIIGNSLGGIIAVEMAKIIPLNKIILISSIKTVDEAPWHFYLFRALPIYKLIPGKVFNAMGGLIRPIFGRMNAADEWLFKDMLKKTSPVFLKWAMGAILHWDNKVVPKNLYHITGEKDIVLPNKRVKNSTVIKGGSHIMIFDKAKEINKLLKGILKK